MIRAWTRHLAPARSPRLLFALRRRILYWKLQHFALRLSTQISPNTVPATKNDTPTSPNAAPATKSDTPRSPNTAPATKSSTPRSPNAAPATKSQLLLSCYSTELLLSCYSTELLLNCYSTELLLNCYWTELLLNCYWTELNLLLKWAVTELLLNWAEPVTQVSCYWTVTQVSCYWTVTQLSCYWTVTQLSWTCYSTELLLNCYSSELLLNCYSTELLLNCYSSELLLNWAVIAFLKLRNSEVSHLNFLWLKILHIVSELLWESKRVLRYCHSSWIPLSVLTFSNYFQSDGNPCHCWIHLFFLFSKFMSRRFLGNLKRLDSGARAVLSWRLGDDFSGLAWGVHPNQSCFIYFFRRS